MPEALKIKGVPVPLFPYRGGAITLPHSVAAVVRALRFGPVLYVKGFPHILEPEGGSAQITIDALTTMCRLLTLDEVAQRRGLNPIGRGLATCLKSATVENRKGVELSIPHVLNELPRDLIDSMWNLSSTGTPVEIREGGLLLYCMGVIAPATWEVLHDIPVYWLVTQRGRECLRIVMDAKFIDAKYDAGTVLFSAAEIFTPDQRRSLGGLIGGDMGVVDKRALKTLQPDLIDTGGEDPNLWLTQEWKLFVLNVMRQQYVSPNRLLDGMPEYARDWFLMSFIERQRPISSAVSSLFQHIGWIRRRDGGWNYTTKGADVRSRYRDYHDAAKMQAGSDITLDDGPNDAADIDLFDPALDEWDIL